MQATSPPPPPPHTTTAAAAPRQTFTPSTQLSPRTYQRRRAWSQSLEGCPVCGTELDAKHLSSSSCCGGAVVCDSCLATELPTDMARAPCPACGERLRRQDFRRGEDIHQQRYKREAQQADRVHSVFNLERSDFPDDDAWNQYLEEKQDFLYDLAYCKPSERKAVEERLEQYRRENQHRIELAHQRQQAAIRAQEERSADAFVDVSAPDQPPPATSTTAVFHQSHLPVFTLPEVISKGVKSSTSSASQSRAQDWQRSRQAEERKLGVEWWFQRCQQAIA